MRGRPATEEQTGAKRSLISAPWELRPLGRVVKSALVLGLVVLIALTLSNQRSILRETERSQLDTRIASIYQDARFWVGQEESLERKYRLEPGPAVLALHAQAQRNLTADLRQVRRLDGSPATRRFVDAELQRSAEYSSATRSMFAAVVAGNTPLVLHIDHVVVDPIFTALEKGVFARAGASTERALALNETLERDETNGSVQNIIGIVLLLTVLGLLAWTLRRARRARSTARKLELERLKQLVVTDPLTGLRNHRAFHEDLALEMQRTGRTGVPTSLVMLDADDLKRINDSRGHQAGDETLVKLARAIALTPRASDRAYRVGGDEFAVILHDTGEWAAFEFAQRLLGSLRGADGEGDGDGDGDGDGVAATAGIAQALVFRTKDSLIREADLALMNAKRFDQDVVIYTPEMQPFSEATPEHEDEHQTRKLAKALALAVDSKDSYTRSHSQTVATLCAVIAGELGIDGGRLRQIRLAGLLHDVGKIGIPDSILKKPAKLTDEEFADMKRHPELGRDIVLAAEMPLEAGWVLHHHERMDGRGYPNRLSGEEIPLESRIIHVADAFEAMTSDRPYRDAPGEEFALLELERHAGTQFDPEVVAAAVRALGSPSGRAQEVTQEQRSPTRQPDVVSR